MKKLPTWAQKNTLWLMLWVYLRARIDLAHSIVHGPEGYFVISVELPAIVRENPARTLLLTCRSEEYSQAMPRSTLELEETLPMPLHCPSIALEC
jgi:hypothetical protein